MSTVAPPPRPHGPANGPDAVPQASGAGGPAGRAAPAAEQPQTTLAAGAVAPRRKRSGGFMMGLLRRLAPGRKAPAQAPAPAEAPAGGPAATAAPGAEIRVARHWLHKLRLLAPHPLLSAANQSAAPTPSRSLRDPPLPTLDHQKTKQIQNRRQHALATHQEGIRNRLRQVLSTHEKWEAAHPIDIEKILQALQLVNEGHRSKHGWGERNAHYSQATRLMREGVGIDQATYERAKRQFGLQGLADVYDSAVSTLFIGPTLAAVAGPGADLLSEPVGDVIKYTALALLVPLSNATGQIAVDAYQDTIVQTDGVPVAAADITATATMWDLHRQVTALLERAHALRAVHADQSQSIAARNDALQELRGVGAQLETLHQGYRKRIALGLANFVKYEFQVMYKLVTAPAVAAAGVFGGPLALWAAAAVQQAGQAPFGYLDEIMLKDHIMRFNTKYADVLTAQATVDGKARGGELEAHDIDLDKVRKLWSRPLDVIRGNIALVCTEELARRLRRQTKLDKAGAKQHGQGDAGKVERSNMRAGAAAIERLQSDIVAFRDNHWEQLDPGGTIANMLLDRKKHFALLARAKYRRPGEFTAQVLDRHGGLVFPRALGAAFTEGLGLPPSAPAGGASDVANAAIAQTAALAGNAYWNPITKFTKQRVVRAQLMRRDALAGQELLAEPIYRSSFRGRRPVTAGRLLPVVRFGPEERPVVMNLTQTRAWMNHKNSSAMLAANGTVDAAVGLATHLNAALTLPARFGAGAFASHRAKRAQLEISRMMPAIATPAAPAPPLAQAPAERPKPGSAEAEPARAGP